MADQHTSSLIPASNPFPKRHKGLAVEEVKGPVVAGHLGLADGHVNPLGLEVRVRPGGKKNQCPVMGSGSSPTQRSRDSKVGLDWGWGGPFLLSPHQCPG